MLQLVQDLNVLWCRANGVRSNRRGTVTNLTAVRRTGIVACIVAWVSRLSQGAANKVTICPSIPSRNVARLASNKVSQV